MKVIKNVVQPVFSVGYKIRFKSTGDVDKVITVTHGGRFVNSVNVEDIEKISEDDIVEDKDFYPVENIGFDNSAVDCVQVQELKLSLKNLMEE